MHFVRAAPFLGHGFQTVVSTLTSDCFPKAFVFVAALATSSSVLRAFALPFSPSASKYLMTPEQAFAAFAIEHTFGPKPYANWDGQAANASSGICLKCLP